MSNADKVAHIKNTFDRVFNNEDGRLVLSVMANECSLNDVGKYETDSNLAYYNNGKRYFIMKILSILRIDLATFLDMYGRSEWNPMNSR